VDLKNLNFIRLFRVSVVLVLNNPIRTETQANGHIRHWGFIEDFRYYPDTDMLYLELLRKVSTEYKEVAPNIVQR